MDIIVDVRINVCRGLWPGRVAVIQLLILIVGGLLYYHGIDSIDQINLTLSL